MSATAFLRRLCRKLGHWLLRVGEPPRVNWRRLRGLETESPAVLRTRQHLWRRVARELGHRAPGLGTSSL
jgi:hypothetical protein